MKLSHQSQHHPNDSLFPLAGSAVALFVLLLLI
jgi:hypothetical protein